VERSRGAAAVEQQYLEANLIDAGLSCRQAGTTFDGNVQFLEYAAENLNGFGIGAHQ